MLCEYKETSCSICGSHGDFILPYPDASLRESVCQTCNASRRSRDVARVLLAYVNITNASLTQSLDSLKHLHIIEFQAQGSLHNVLKVLPYYVATEFFPNTISGEIHSSGILSQDLHCLTFPDATSKQGFDIAITQDIFEHLENPWLAFSEVARILRPTGQHIFTVPVHVGKATQIRAQRSIAGNIEHLLPAVYHGDPLSGTACLVFTDFGDDIPKLLQQHDIVCKEALHCAFYDATHMPCITTEKEHARYTFFSSRKKLLKFFLYNSTVFKAYGKPLSPQDSIKNNCVRIRYQDCTNALQTGLEPDFFEKYFENEKPHISNIRAEKITFFGTTCLALDFTLCNSKHEATLLMTMLTMGELSTLTLPSIFSSSKHLRDFLSQSFVTLVPILQKKSLPCLIDDTGKDIPRGKVSERMLPGISSYYTVVPHIRRYAFVRARLQEKEAQRFLDVGCGQGYGLAILVQSKATAIGVGLDISSEAITTAQKNYPSSQLTWLLQSIEDSLEQKTLPHQTYTCITCFENIEHLDSPDACLALVKKHLAPDGSFYISIPNPRLHGTDKNHYHKRDYSFLHMKTLLETNFGHVEYFSQDDEGGDLAQRFCIIKEEDADAQFWIACCQQALPVTRSKCYVSIIMPLFNNFQYTEKAIDSIYATLDKGTNKLSWELILIDNASTDETISYTARDIRTSIYRNAINEGFAKASNQGALLAQGDILIFLNNDTEVHQGWLEALVNELECNVQTGLVSGRLLYPNNTIQHAGVVVGRDMIPYHIHCGLDAEHPLVLQRQEYPVVTGACMAARKKEFFEIGMFDEHFVNGHEDIDLCIRYRKLGFTCIYRPDCVVTHHESVSEGRMDSRLQNVQRTLTKSYDWLVQDDFVFKAFPLIEDQFHANKLRFAIKIGVPNRQQKGWGDIYFAESFAKELVRKGHSCEIHYLNDWGQDDKDIDVVIHIKGLSKYYPKPWNINIMWMINHPELHTHEELESYDAICVASKLYAQKLQKELSKPVYTLLQATDFEHFSLTPNTKLSDKEQIELEKLAKEYDIVFVGNNTGMGRESMRKIISFLLPSHKQKIPYSIGIWGVGWDGFVPSKYLIDDFISWELLPYLYNRTKIVLNDHQPSMAEQGFVNNRTFDITACCVPQICDVVHGMEDVIDVQKCATAKELHDSIKKILDNPEEAKKHAQKNYTLALEKFSFATRAQEIYDIIEHIKTPELQKRIENQRSIAFSDTFMNEGPLVSILMSTYNRNMFLPDAIQSIIDQSYAHWELCLVCDGGTPVDNIVKKFDDPRIRLLHKEVNQGKSKCINAAFVMSKGEYIAYLDDDDIWYPDHLEKLVRPLCHMSGFKMVYSNALELTLDFQQPYNIKEIKKEVRYNAQVTISQMLEFNQINGISVVHSRDLFEAVGGLDENLRVLIDFDMWRRLMCFSYAYHVSYTTSKHYLRQNLTHNKSITTLFERDLLTYIKQRIKILKKKLENDMEKEHVEVLSEVRERSLFEFYYALCEQAIQNKNMLRCKKLLPITAKYCNSIHTKTKFATFLMNIGYVPQALEIFKNTFPFVKKEVHTLFLMLACAIELKNSFIKEILKALNKNIPYMSDKEKELLEFYKNRL